MGDSERSVARQKFCDVAVLWNVDVLEFGHVIHAARDVAAAGAAGPAMALLASVSHSSFMSPFEVHRCLAGDLAEVGYALFPRQTEDAQEVAVRAMARRTLRGEVSPRDITAWAHEYVSHQGLEVAQRLVELEDEFDLAEAGTRGSVDGVTAEVMAEVQRLVADT